MKGYTTFQIHMLLDGGEQTEFPLTLSDDELVELFEQAAFLEAVTNGLRPDKIEAIEIVENEK